MYWALVCVCGLMLFCIKVCGDVGFFAIPNICYIKGFYTNRTCLAITLCSFVILYSSFPSPTCHVSLLNHDVCYLHSRSSPRRPHSSSYSPSPQLHMATFSSFSREVPEQSFCVLSGRKGVTFCQRDHSPRDLRSMSVSLPYDPVPGTFARFLLLSRVLRLVIERERSPAGIL